jgi:RecA/RadA recombinase
MPDNRIIGLAGESSVGKTYLALSIIKTYLDADPKNVVAYYDTEAAINKAQLISRGIDPKRVIIAEVDTLQNFKTHCLKTIDAYSKVMGKDKPRLLMVLDSLGMLSTSKEMADSTEGKDVKDMTRPQIVRAVFRTITLKAARARVPLIVTNHVYVGVGMYPTNEVSGGGGFKYACSAIIMLGKSKDKDGMEVVGNFIRAKNYKSRFGKENAQISMRLSYKTGLDKYYGLLELAERHGIFKKVSTRYELPDGRKVFGKSINENPTEYFTEEILDRLEKCAVQDFSYGDHDDGEADDADLANIVADDEDTLVVDPELKD